MHPMYLMFYAANLGFPVFADPVAYVIANIHTGHAF